MFKPRHTFIASLEKDTCMNTSIIEKLIRLHGIIRRAKEELEESDHELASNLKTAETIISELLDEAISNS